MKQELLHIYGPFAIRSYGVAIVLGLLAFSWLIQRHKKFKEHNLEHKYPGMLLVGIMAGLLGGRIIYLLSEGIQQIDIFSFFALWEGGLSILGCILGIAIVGPLYLKYIKVPILHTLDLVAIHAPLAQAIARLGCLFAGCCFGCVNNGFWSITYTDPLSLAPLHQPLYPTQIYSSVALLIIFLCMYYGFQKIVQRPGQLALIYLILVSSERFILDFWRGDRPIIQGSIISLFSLYQLIALAIFIISFVLLLYSYKQAPKALSDEHF